MKRFTLAVLLSILCSTAFAQFSFLERSTPENEGLRSRDILNYIDTVMRQKDTDIHGVMILRNGKVIAEKYNEPFAAQYGHTLYSCSKTFTAVGVGLAIQDSLLHLDDPIVCVLDSAMLPPVIGDSLAAITVENLLTMQSSLPVDTRMRTIEDEWVKAYLSRKMVDLPGTLFAYDSIDSYLLAAIVQHVTGKTLFQLLRDRIFTPMGITQVSWEQSPEGVSCGGWGLYMQLESMAKFGQLLVQRGEWKGEQLVSSDWIDQMLTHHATNAGGSRYGYHIWLMDNGIARCDGAYGQYIYVIPNRNMVIAMTQCMRGNGNLEHNATKALAAKAPENGAAFDPITPTADQKTLQNARYRLSPAKGKPSSDHHLFPIHMRLPKNDLGWSEIELDLRQTKRQQSPIVQATVTTRTGETFPLICDYQDWHTNEIKGLPLNFREFRNNFSNILPPFYVAASYSWVNDDALSIRLQFVNWLTSCRLQFNFNGTTTVRTEFQPGHSNKHVTFTSTILK